MGNLFSAKQDIDLPEPRIDMAQALAIGKELTLLNDGYWDDATATARLSSEFFEKRCWEVMPGIEEKEWTEQETDEHPTRILLDADTGNFAGLAYTRTAIPAEQLVDRYFILPIASGR